MKHEAPKCSDDHNPTYSYDDNFQHNKAALVLLLINMLKYVIRQINVAQCDYLRGGPRIFKRGGGVHLILMCTSKKGAGLPAGFRGFFFLGGGEYIRGSTLLKIIIII